jgi:hypothetical protein
LACSQSDFPVYCFFSPHPAGAVWRVEDILPDAEVFRFGLCRTPNRHIPTCPVTDDYGADRTAVSWIKNENQRFNDRYMDIHLCSNNLRFE